MRAPFRHILAPLVLACLSAGSGQAQSLSDILSVELMPGWTTDAGSHIAAVRVKLSQGWKTYWRSPGEAGIPPSFDWSGSQNIERVDIHWPTPQVFDFNGMQSIGYARELVLPVEIWPNEAGRDVTLDSSIDLGVCRDICVPATVKLHGTLSSKGAANPEIHQALRNQPKSAGKAGVRATRCHVEPTKRGLRLLAEVDMPKIGPNEVVVIEASDPRIWVSETETRRSGQMLLAEATMIGPSRKPFGLDRSGITLTVLADGVAVEIQGCTGN